MVSKQEFSRVVTKLLRRRSRPTKLWSDVSVENPWRIGVGQGGLEFEDLHTNSRVSSKGFLSTLG